jgi:drug/metabolite transporter (DMT)-like permease
VKLLRGYILPAAMVLIGVALIVRTIFGGGGPVAIGIILGLLFVAAGVGRIYVERSLK